MTPSVDGKCLNVIISTQCKVISCHMVCKVSSKTDACKPLPKRSLPFCLLILWILSTRVPKPTPNTPAEGNLGRGYPPSRTIKSKIYKGNSSSDAFFCAHTVPKVKKVLFEPMRPDAGVIVRVYQLPFTHCHVICFKPEPNRRVSIESICQMLPSSS